MLQLTSWREFPNHNTGRENPKRTQSSLWIEESGEAEALRTCMAEKSQHSKKSYRKRALPRYRVALETCWALIRAQADTFCLGNTDKRSSCKEAVGIISRDHTKLEMVHDPKSQVRKYTGAWGRVLRRYCLTNWGQISPRLGSVSKESTCSVEDPGLISGLGRFPREENGNPLQYFCLENSITEEPGGLQSRGSQRVEHNWMTDTHIHSPRLKTALIPSGKN